MSETRCGISGDLVDKKEKVSVSADSDLLAWIDSQVKSGRFASRSHAFRYAAEKLRQEESDLGG